MQESRQAPLGNSHFTRGRFISLGLSMGAGAAFVACSSGENTSGGDGGSSGSSEDSGEAQGASGGAIVAVSEVPVGESYEFENEGEPAVLIHQQEDQFVAYSAVCTHQGCTVAYQDSALSCPCHGSVFDPASGEPNNGPASSPLPSIEVAVRDGEVVRV